ncbi:MAG: deaminase [Thermoplasmata archaeon]|nr:deaminase [Thermoplasmata archaeon]
MKNGILAAEGIISDRYGRRRGWVTAEDGVVTGMGDGDCPTDPDVTGFILADTLNMHTHCADYGLKVPEGMSLEELVAPPDGLKHRYLRETPADVLGGSMERFSSDSRSFGSTSFVDFREGGVGGCRLLRSRCPDAVILGRPVSPEFDPEEVSAILDVADGIGISSVSDMDPAYIEQVADAVRERRMVFAIHVSERVREDIDFVLSLDPAFVVHMCEATEDDMGKCAEAEVPVVVCPTSNLYFGRRPPIALAQACGVDLALGTDNGMLCRPDMVAEAAVFAEEAERQGGDPSDSLRALARLSRKILNAVKSNHVAAFPGPVAVLPAPDLDAVGAVRNGAERIILEQQRRI